MNETEIGRKGEKIAESYLLEKGYATLARNYRFQSAEIDLIMRDGDTTVYVEVKTRRGDTLPRLAVTPQKQALICRAAVGYAKQNALLEKRNRFDVVEVYWRGGIPEIQHFIDAFPFVSERFYV